MMPQPSRYPLPARPPSLRDTDELLAMLATFPRHPEVTGVLDEVLDYRRALGHASVPCYGCAGSRTDGRGRPCRRCGGSGWEPNP